MRQCRTTNAHKWHISIPRRLLYCDNTDTSNQYNSLYNYGGLRFQIAFLWSLKCCGHRAQWTVVTKGRHSLRQLIYGELYPLNLSGYSCGWVRVRRLRAWIWGKGGGGQHLRYRSWGGGSKERYLFSDWLIFYYVCRYFKDKGGFCRIKTLKFSYKQKFNEQGNMANVREYQLLASTSLFMIKSSEQSSSNLASCCAEIFSEIYTYIKLRVRARINLCINILLNPGLTSSPLLAALALALRI